MPAGNGAASVANKELSNKRKKREDENGAAAKQTGSKDNEKSESVKGKGTHRREKEADKDKKKASRAGQQDSQNSNDGGSDDDQDGSESEYEVDFIEGHNFSKEKGPIQFFVRWKNYKAEDNTWEPFDFFAHDAPRLAEKYIKTVLKHYKVPAICKNFQNLVTEEEKKEKSQP